MTRGLDLDKIDKKLRELKPNAEDYLRVFHAAGQGAKFGQCAQSIGVSEATFSRAIKDLDKTFQELTGGIALLRRDTNGYVLTTAGVQYGEKLAEGRLQIYETLDEASRDGLSLKLRLSNECFPEYGMLKDAAEKHSRITVLPAPSNSADLDLHLPSRGTPATLTRAHALYTTCQSATNLVSDGMNRVTLRDCPDTDVIPTRQASFKLAVHKDVFVSRSGTVTHDDLIDNDLELVLPDEGAVLDFLNRLERPGTHRRVRRHGGGPRFDHCRRTLKSGCYRRGAMLVHGRVEHLFPPEYGFFPFSDLKNVKAVTGFYRRMKAGPSRPWPNEAEEAWMTLWTQAIDLFGRKDAEQ